MKKYLIMPEGCKWYKVDAVTPEGAYRGVCSWYSKRTKIGIMDLEDNKVYFYRER